MSFERALTFTLSAEGGLSDNPADHGGETLHGVTQSTYDHYRRETGNVMQRVALMTDEEMHNIYERYFWIDGHCDNMPERLGVAHFDTCVNLGVPEASRLLQKCLGVKVDGIIGSITCAKIETSDEQLLVASYLALREDKYQRIVDHDPTQAEFLNGWLIRVKRLQAYIDQIEPEVVA